MTSFELPLTLASFSIALANYAAAGRAGVLPIKNASLCDDVAAWLRDNVAGKFSTSMIDSDTDSYEITFECDDDAILFKLTWL